MVLSLSLDRPGAARDLEPPRDTPDFAQRDANFWIDSPPLSLQVLHGKVVLIDFWTFDCWNCYRSATKVAIRLMVILAVAPHNVSPLKSR